MTPLMLACSNCDLAMVKLLVYYGANVWALNVNKQTAFEIVFSSILLEKENQKNAGTQQLNVYEQEHSN